jgi:hypothetical protein
MQIRSINRVGARFPRPLFLQQRVSFDRPIGLSHKKPPSSWEDSAVFDDLSELTLAIADAWCFQL